MPVVELTDSKIARTYLLQGLCLQRFQKPEAKTVRPILDWCMELSSNGQALLPSGLIADFGHMAFSTHSHSTSRDFPEVPGWPHSLLRSYEDHVLGKIYTDWSFERAGDGLRRYSTDEQARGLAYILKQFRHNAKLPGVELSPAVIRAFRMTNPQELLEEGYDSLLSEGPLPLLVEQYEQLVAAMRRIAEILSLEDVLAIEQRTALADLGQYVAHRQILSMSHQYDQLLPARPVLPQAGRREVPSKVLDDDQYPVGGYSSISTRGTIESLLHSQLAYIEDEERPDLFEIKYVRDELFYYSRDENQFLRRRRMFAFVFPLQLKKARIKDVDLPAQRIVMWLAGVVSLIRKLTEWLDTDAIRFELIFLESSNENDTLTHEWELLEILLQEDIHRGSAGLRLFKTTTDILEFLQDAALHSQVHLLQTDMEMRQFDLESVVQTTVLLNSSRPQLYDGHFERVELTSEEDFAAWVEALTRILELWI